MRPVRSVLVAAAVSFPLAGFAAAQVVRPSVRVASGSATTKNGECSLASSPLLPSQVLVEWQRLGDPDGRVHWAVSADRAATFTSPATFFPTSPPYFCNTFNHGDPTDTASTLTGEAWAGCLLNPSVEIDAPVPVMALARYVTGSLTLTDHAPIGDCSDNEDRCRVAGGPWPPGTTHGPTEAVYMAYDRDGLDLNVFASLDASPSGSSWQPLPYPVSVDGMNVEQGFGPFLSVVQTGANAGRVLMASAAGRFSPPISVYRTDTGGAGLWNVRLISFDNDAAHHLLNSVPINGAHIPGGVYVESVPTMAIDPSNPARVVVAFPARIASDTENVDLFIAVSEDGGDTFQPVTGVGNTAVHIQDDWLRIPGEVLPSWGSQEWQPSIAIDQAGGVDVLFSRSVAPHTALPENAQVETRLARWSSITALAGC